MPLLVVLLTSRVECGGPLFSYPQKKAALSPPPHNPTRTTSSIHLLPPFVQANLTSWPDHLTSWPDHLTSCPDQRKSVSIFAGRLSCSTHPVHCSAQISLLQFVLPPIPPPCYGHSGLARDGWDSWEPAAHKAFQALLIFIVRHKITAEGDAVLFESLGTLVHEQSEGVEAALN
jgi:hypothetical protein